MPAGALTRTILILVLAMTLTPPAPLSAAAETRQVEADGATLAVEQFGANGPVAIFEACLGEPMDSWREVAQALSSCMRVVMYDRPGLGASGPRTETGPAMADDVAQRLHALTDALALPRPYIVVGHSLGGFYAQMFARRYPNDVAAVVLVDAASQFEPPGVFVSKNTPKPGSVAEAEEEGMRLSEAKAGNEPPFPSVPLIVLAATYHDMSPELERLWQETQRKLPSLSPKGKLEVVTGSGHFIQTDRPQAVVDAVKVVAREAGNNVEACAAPAPAAAEDGAQAAIRGALLQWASDFNARRADKVWSCSSPASSATSRACLSNATKTSAAD